MGRIQGRKVKARRPAEIKFAVLIVVSALFLQRLGLHIGSAYMSFVGPLGLLLGVRGLVRGELSFHRGRLTAYVGLVFFITLGMTEQALFPPALFVMSSPLSILQFLLLSSFATLSFTHVVDELAFFAVVQKWLAVIAVAGILQFLLQFVHIAIFSFQGIVPSTILAEEGWNLMIPAGMGALLKANGFFLNEPSIFSQFMAVGLIIELLGFRRPWFCVLYLVALLLSFSGTGWIVLGTFVVAAGVSLGMRGLLLALSTVLVLGAGLVAVYLLAPDVISVFGQRATEVFRPGTSGHLRFVTPIWLLDSVLARVPASLFFGIGGGMSEHLTMPYDYNVNTPIKIILEYGAPAFACYLLLLLAGERSPLQRGLVAPCVVLLLFTGSYSQFPPILFFVLLLISVARLSAPRGLPDADLAH